MNDPDFWKAMYRALLKRVAEIADSDQDHGVGVEDLRVVVNAHRTLPVNAHNRSANRG